MFVYLFEFSCVAIEFSVAFAQAVNDMRYITMGICIHQHSNFAAIYRIYIIRISVPQLYITKIELYMSVTLSWYAVRIFIKFVSALMYMSN